MSTKKSSISLKYKILTKILQNCKIDINVTIADSPLRSLSKEIYCHKDDLADRKSDTIQILHKSDTSIVFLLPEQTYPILFATDHQAYFDTCSSSIPDLAFSNIFKKELISKSGTSIHFHKLRTYLEN